MCIYVCSLEKFPSTDNFYHAGFGSQFIFFIEGHNDTFRKAETLHGFGESVHFAIEIFISQLMTYLNGFDRMITLVGNNKIALTTAMKIIDMVSIMLVTQLNEYQILQ